MDEHIPVMLDEVLEYLLVSSGQRYIDCTLGAGGYTKAILQKGGIVLGLEQDPKALEIARRNLGACPGTFSLHERTPGPFKLINSNFSKLKEVAIQEDFVGVSGIVFDLGFASFQMDNPERGLAFSQNGPLDMRLDPNLGVTAADLVNTLPEKQLHELFRDVGQERLSFQIAKAIVKERLQKPFTTTFELKDLIERVYGSSKNALNIHPATKVYMALRIAVNTELENLKEALPQAFEILKPGGRLVVVSFHSGEDRIVKQFTKEKEKEIKMLLKKPLKPTEEEVEKNPRSRSAILRAIEKI